MLYRIFFQLINTILRLLDNSLLIIDVIRHSILELFKIPCFNNKTRFSIFDQFW